MPWRLPLGLSREALSGHASHEISFTFGCLIEATDAFCWLEFTLTDVDTPFLSFLACHSDLVFNYLHLSLLAVKMGMHHAVAPTFEPLARDFIGTCITRNLVHLLVLD
jgi:hypothetical protein